MLPASLALILAVLLGVGVYLSNGAAVRRRLDKDRRSDDPLRRIRAVDTAVVGQLAGIGHGGAGGLATLVGLTTPTLGGAIFLAVCMFLALGVPVVLWERHRLTQIRA